MPSRKYSVANTNYRYGFNGKENDNDIENSAQDYGMRIYDGRLGRFLSADPLTKTYPWLTPYQFAGNTPMQAIDIDGLEPIYISNNCFAPFDLFGNDLFGSYSGDGEKRKFGDGGTYRTSGRAYINLTTFEKPKFTAGNTLSTYKRYFGSDYSHQSPSFIKETYSSDPNEKFFHLNMQISGGNKAAIYAADIDNHLNINFLKISDSKVFVFGSVNGDRFPANETILNDKFGNQLILGVSGPNNSKNIGPYKNLPGNNHRKMQQFSLNILFNKDESFKGVELNGKEYSREEWNNIFKNLDPKDTQISTKISYNGKIKTKEDK